MRRALVIGVMFVAVVGMFSCGLQALVGVGFTYTGQVPYGTVIGQWGSFGMQAGIGTASRSHAQIGGSFTEIWYCVNGKYFFTLPVLGEALQPYLGGGIVGVILNESMEVSGGEVTVSASTIGGEVLGGLQYSLASLGLPVVISGGASYMTVAETTVTYRYADGETGTYVLILPSGGVGVHFGIHVAF